MKPERFTAVVFVLLITGFMVSVFYSFASRKVIYVMDDSMKQVKIDWEKIYPFKNARNESISKIASFYEYVKGKLEGYTSKYLFCYYNLVETAKKYEDTVG